MEQLAKDKELQDNFFVSGLTMAFLPKLVNSTVDVYVTSAGIATLINKGSIPNFDKNGIGTLDDKIKSNLQ